MHKRLDPFTVSLNRLDYSLIYEFFRDIGAETQRLEFKQEVNPEALAREAAAMANGTGGLIIVGYKDPKDGVPLEPHNFTGGEDEPSRRRLLSRIQARVYPSLPLDAISYFNTERTHHILVLRVDSSTAAPHEILNDRGKFVIRRGTEVAGMTLRELEAMIQKRNAPSNTITGRSAEQYYQMISLDRTVPEGFVGIRIFPETQLTEEPLSKTLQSKIERVVRDLRGLNITAGQTYPDGILFKGFPPPAEAEATDGPRLERWLRRAYVGADGHYELRDTEIGASYREMLMTSLCNAYVLGSTWFRHLGLGPRARGTLVCHRRSAPQLAHAIAGDGDFKLNIDFSTDSVLDMIRKPMMYALRTAGTLTDPSDIDTEVANFWSQEYSGTFKIDLCTYWD